MVINSIQFLKMTIRDLFSRSSSSKRSKSQGSNSDKDDDTENLPTPSQQTENPTQKSSQHLEVSTQGPVKGLRKASSVSASRLSARKHPSKSAEYEPSDYLYFGEGVSAADVSKSLSNRNRSKSTSNISGHPSTTSTSNTANPNGRDNSGFLNTGMNTHTAQMGYSNLTYGGSLQFDYSGTQVGGPGI
ncbi:uncharacterized protein F4822DRAFT_418118 [Hypoxylon trugodes]|uniref:uncharacterized protein n=1 Tax=Hypoxylon trugodes TaxID=326681 RepID=UPI00218F79F5|nr:uncharacterized protein F4822DRAFT_418118 [Hypoxylon trugodes]KAI1383954.1 hypothetical protein F4822DRAFT_418118 [Hypoxylon trugodes]